MQVQQTTYLTYCVRQVRCLLYLHKPNSGYALLVVLRTTSVKPQVRCLFFLHKPNSAYALPLLVVLRTTSVKTTR